MEKTSRRGVFENPAVAVSVDAYLSQLFAVNTNW